jgi:hypothetical protein
MALNNGYGILRGTLTEHHRDNPDAQGRWYHVNLAIDAGGNAYKVAVDVDSKASAIGVQWKVVDATLAELHLAAATPPGWQLLASNASSGALDHIRHRVTALLRIVRRRSPWWRWLTLRIQPWKSGTFLDASVALESILAVGGTMLVWGEPFTQGLGVHNVHQNQGDPQGSQWWPENAIWQDGGVARVDPDGTVRLFVSKFSSQSSKTDAQGHPA